MSVMRGLGRWILSLLISLLLTLWVVAVVLQSTLLSQQTVSGWLSSSGAYQHVLDVAFQLHSNQIAIGQQDLQNALAATFPPHYIEQQANTVLKATYDWIDGRSPTIDFSIPIKDKRAEYSANLQKVLTAKVTKLPVCSSVASLQVIGTCVPPGLKPSDVAAEFSQIAGSSDFLNNPVTPASISAAGVPQAPYLPALASIVRVSVIALPVITIMAAVGFVMLSSPRLHGLLVVGRRALIHGLLVTILGGLLWYLGNTWDASAALKTVDSTQLAAVKSLVNPVMQLVLPDIGRLITLCGLVIALAGGLTMLASFLIKQHKPKQLQRAGQPPTLPPQPKEQA
ncbi:MAG TPA: hypothetical protein VLG40_03705 [Candidatus Saccharimonas sp.]|nr:hypothetical protein [Candidatus Saccharimonas sp.]